MGGEVETKVITPYYRPVKRIGLEDYVYFTGMFEKFPMLFRYFHYLADCFEYELASTPFDEKNDRARIAAQAKLLVMKDLLNLPEIAAKRLKDAKLHDLKEGKVISNFGEELQIEK